MYSIPNIHVWYIVDCSLATKCIVDAAQLLVNVYRLLSNEQVKYMNMTNKTAYNYLYVVPVQNYVYFYCSVGSCGKPAIVPYCMTNGI